MAAAFSGLVVLAGAISGFTTAGSPFRPIVSFAGVPLVNIAPAIDLNNQEVVTVLEPVAVELDSETPADIEPASETITEPEPSPTAAPAIVESRVEKPVASIPTPVATAVPVAAPAVVPAPSVAASSPAGSVPVIESPAKQAQEPAPPTVAQPASQVVAAPVAPAAAVIAPVAAPAAAPVLSLPAGYSVYVSTNGCLPNGGICPFGPVPSNYYWAPTSTAVVFTNQSAWTLQHEACHAHQHLVIKRELGLEPAAPYDLHEWMSTSEGRAWSTQVPAAWPATGQWAREPGEHNAIEDFGISCGLFTTDPEQLRQIDPARYAVLAALLR